MRRGLARCQSRVTKAARGHRAPGKSFVRYSDSAGAVPPVVEGGRPNGHRLAVFEPASFEHPLFREHRDGITTARWHQIVTEIDEYQSRRRH
jgi:hypothetical protein